ncbi:methyltransferase [Schaalia sp. Marseille-Q2122]|uniref:DUF7059 domain-containing protein n=1 Tax=Schaalia sp. Marseille-Q2122 TaxID=2736604 RepID=UPI00158E460D|nr:methyltransferase [Schaalia sp. Marseille-Q2122]
MSDHTPTSASPQTSATASPSPVPALNPTLIARLRADLAEAGWTVERMDTLLSEAARAALMRDQRVPALVELRAPSIPVDEANAALLTRLFILGSVETGEDVAAALPALGVEGALELGILRPAGAEWGKDAEQEKGSERENGCAQGKGAGHDLTTAKRSADAEAGSPKVTYSAAFDLRPHSATLPAAEAFAPGGNADAREEHHWWVLSDLGEVTTGQPLHPDHVLGIGGATMSLLALTMRAPVGRALDIGTGCGIQALYLATHAQQVVATDLSARACAITSFNAALNDVRIDVRQGSLFEPVAGERFDLIVSNPPFVITPDSLREGGLLEYRDGGMERDSLIGAIIGQAPAHLNVGGTLQMLGNWEIPADRDPETEWDSRMEGWLEGLNVDAWVLQRDILDPTQYVEMWIRDSGGTLVPRDEVEATYDAWISDFAQAGVGAIGMGSLAMRARSEENASDAAASASPARVYSYVPDGHAPTGRDVALALDILTLPDDIWECSLRCAPDVTEERHFTPGIPDPKALILHQGGGMGRSIRVGSATSAFVGACDGELQAGQIVTALSVLMDVDAQAVREEIASILPELLRAGMLTRC